MEHKEKLEIFDKYVEDMGYECFDAMIDDFGDLRFSRYELINHIMNICNIIQEKALEKASENATCKTQEDLRGGACNLVDKESITNEKNLIK